MLARALYVTKDITFVAEQDGYHARETPLKAVALHDNAGDLGLLLDRLAAVTARIGLHETSLYLDPDAASWFCFPAKMPTSAVKAKDAAALVHARHRGWRVNTLRRWMTFQKDGMPVIHIGLARWMSKEVNPLWDNDPVTAAYLLWRFQNISGQAYHAKPGVMGSRMLNALYRNNSVTWHPETLDVFKQVTITEYNHVNRALVDEIGDGYVHAYDTNRAYLAGAGVADLARTPLIHTGRTQGFDKTISGVWECVVPVWNEKRLPHPMGSNRYIGERVWVTTPTLDLVQQLADDPRGLIQMPLILDSYTAPPRVRDGKKVPCTTRVLREWASGINQCIERAGDEEDPAERAKLVDAFKQCYKESVNGIWKTSSSQIFREDWYYTVGAVVGANLYRKMFSAANATGRFPTFVGNVDAVHYNSEHENPMDDPIKRFNIGNALGSFSVDSYTGEKWRQEHGL